MGRQVRMRMQIIAPRAKQHSSHFVAAVGKLQQFVTGEGADLFHHFQADIRSPAGTAERARKLIRKCRLVSFTAMIEESS